MKTQSTKAASDPVVHHAGPRCRPGNSLVDKLRRLCTAMDFPSFCGDGATVAVKVHWGEPGNTSFVSPVFVGAVCQAVLDAGGRPFVTDTRTLYRGGRRDAIASILSAQSNGFSPCAIHAPLIVADGLAGRDARKVSVPGGKHVREAPIASAILDADAMICISHFKGHELFGFGASLKNLGMGCCSPSGKQILHSDLKPEVVEEKCVSCGRCIEVCPADAIRLEEACARIDQASCVGCGDCTVACPVSAIPIRWRSDERPLLEKTAEYAWAALEGKRDRCAFFNFVTNVIPFCDCMPCSDLAVVPDLGILASRDPVAVDQASADLVNGAPVVPGSHLAESNRDGDLLFQLHGMHWSWTLEHAERLGLGHRSYELAALDAGA